MNLNALINLADKTTTKNEELEFGLGNASTEIKEQIAELVIAERKAVVKEAAMQVVGVLRLTANAEQALVERIRKARAEITRSKEELAQIKREKDYASQTDNYLPLACHVKHNLGFSYSELHQIPYALRTIPKDWLSEVDKTA